VGRGICRRGSVNGGDEGEGMQLMGFIYIYIYKIMMKPLALALRGAGREL
jgi:hypothetical protein